MKKRKIVFYLSSLTKGGAQRVILNLTESLLSKGYEITIVTTMEEENEYELPKGARRVISDLTQEEVTGNRVKNLMGRIRKLRKIWKEERPDLIVSFIGKNNIMAIITSLGLHIPKAVSVRGEPTEEYYNGMLRFLAKHLFALADGIILQTSESKKFFPEHTLRKAVVLPNPLNPIFLTQEEKGKREKMILLVGRLDSNKNQKLAIDSFAEICDKFPEYTMEIWGDGEDKEKLQTYIKELGLEEKILLPGATNNVKEKMARASLYILPSNTEGMPNSLIESMVMGLPCISTDCPCGGPKELIHHGVNGLLVPVKDQKAMAEAMKQILEDQELADRLGREASKIKITLDPSKVNQQWEDYFATIQSQANL